MRLIDADKIDFSQVFIGNSDFARDIREAAQDLINRQPTAYDVDAMCEEIEKTQAGFDCRKCPEAKKEEIVCAKDCSDVLIELIIQNVRNGGKKQ